MRSPSSSESSSQIVQSDYATKGKALSLRSFGRDPFVAALLWIDSVREVGAKRRLRGRNLATADAKRLAETFAIAEFAFKYDLTYSITLNPHTLTGLQVNTPAKALAHDEHFVSKVVATFLNHFFYGAFGACLMEFIEQMKAEGIFNDLVIDVAGEFNRSPKASGFGSDHGWQGKSTMLWTGAITQGPIILGNIATTDSDAAHPGTWGMGAANPQLNREVLNAGHMANSIATRPQNACQSR